MRVSKEQAAENRERILEAAARLMRERGTSGVGVDALTEAAGMTHGSLYSQFGSKERLVEEAVAYAIKAKGQEMPEAFALSDYVSEYLSAQHRDGPGTGCPLAALCCDVSRQSQGVRDRFTAGVCGMIGLLSRRMGSGLKQRHREEKALATVASLVGALVLARAVNDPKLSDDILRATKNRLTADLP
jgi:TetR/AcrR family transcriptional regulator, transcriptional repressor for nem operon